jgi:hypothetical protein
MENSNKLSPEEISIRREKFRKAMKLPSSFIIKEEIHNTVGPTKENIVHGPYLLESNN